MLSKTETQENSSFKNWAKEKHLGNSKIYFSMPFFFKSEYHRTELSLEWRQHCPGQQGKSFSTNSPMSHMTQQWKEWWYMKKTSSKITEPCRRQGNCMGAQLSNSLLQSSTIHIGPIQWKGEYAAKGNTVINPEAKTKGKRLRYHNIHKDNEKIVVQVKSPPLKANRSKYVEIFPLLR